MNQLGVPQCQCGAGYTGRKCEVDQCVDYCLNGATCQRGPKKTTCLCPPGYAGRRCEIAPVSLHFFSKFGVESVLTEVFLSSSITIVMWTWITEY